MRFSIQYVLFTIISIIFMIFISPSTIAIADDTLKTSQLPNLLSSEPPRKETVWVTGLPDYKINLNPWSTNPGFGLPLMYETLFGFNAISQTDIPCIATDYHWNVDGSYIIVNLNPAARWSDGQIIDSDDVIYSYELAKNQELFKEEFEERIDSFLTLDNDTIKINVKPEYHFSRYIEDCLKSNVPIVPKHVWSHINTTYANSTTGELGQEEFANDWWDPSFNSSWKVMSGPYCPVYKDILESIEVYEYREDWWGAKASIYSDLENWNEDPPKYVGFEQYKFSVPSDTAFYLGYIDLYGNYYHHVWEIWENADPDSPRAYIYTWFNRSAPYHLPVSNLMNLVPNHQHSDRIMAIKEFRQALAYAIDYNPILDVVASGYCSRTKPGFIDDNSPFHLPYYDPSVTNMYERNQNISKAVSLLESIPNMIHEVNGSWSYDGIPLGPYEMICPIGWSDAITFTDMVCEDITKNLNITISTLLVEFPTDYKTMIKNFSYDFAMFVMGPCILNTPEIFLDSLRGTHLWNKNVSGWENSTFNDLYKTLECAPQADYETTLNQIQLILAIECPEIPCFVLGYWYHFNNYYWEGWPCATNYYQQICRTWTDEQWTIKQRLFLNLISTFKQDNLSSISWLELEFFLIIGFISVIIIYVNLKAKFRKNQKVVFRMH